jgi:phosphohistidine phosphatase
MKTLYLLRHAHAGKGSAKLRDFDRPLDEKGLEEAPLMAARLEKSLRDRGDSIALILSSPALRTLTTARIFARTLQDGDAEVVLEPQVYMASSSRLLQILRRLDDRIDSVLLVGHNPAISDLANEMSQASIHDIPPCGMVILQLPVDSWGEADSGMARLSGVAYPDDRHPVIERLNES